MPESKPAERFKDLHFSEDSLLKADPMDDHAVSLRLTWCPRHLHASAGHGQNQRFTKGGFGIQWPDIDQDLFIEGFLRCASASRKATMSSSEALWK